MSQLVQGRSSGDVGERPAYTPRAAQKRTFLYFAKVPLADSCTAANSLIIRSPRRRGHARFRSADREIIDVL
jgi:hypothetical protein